MLPDVGLERYAVRLDDREEVDERSVLKLGWYSVSVKEYTLLSLTGEMVLVKRLAEDLMEETKAAEERTRA